MNLGPIGECEHDQGKILRLVPFAERRIIHMIEFLKTHYIWLIGAILVAVVIIRVVLTLRKTRRIDREGIETDAVVSRVEDTSDPDSATSSYSTYVEYRDENGEMRESYMALTVRPEYAVGQKVRIKFVPGVHDLVRPEK